MRFHPAIVLMPAMLLAPGPSGAAGSPVEPESADRPEELETMETGDLLIVDFAADPDRLRWEIVNDGVMGGVSRSRFTLSDSETAVFEGTVSLENNGGFASVRSLPAGLDLEGTRGIVCRVRGDGKNYQFRIRTDGNWDGIAYQATFSTVEDEWTEVRIPYEEFVPSFRGRRVMDAPPLRAERIKRVGFLIADKQRGDFRLEISRIGAYR